MKFRLLILFWGLIFPLLASASLPEFQLRMEHEYTVPDAQIFKPYIGIGPDELVDLDFKMWIPIDGESRPADQELVDNAIGLTVEGQVYHTVQIGLNNYARLLSGKRCVEDIQLLNSDPQLLLAKDCSGRVLVYDSSLWHQRFARKIFLSKSLETVVIGGLTYSMVTLLVPIYGADLSPELQTLMKNAMLGLTGVSIFMTQALGGVLRFGQRNQWVNSFYVTPYQVGSLEELSESQLGEIIESAAPSAGDWKVSCKAILNSHIERNLLSKYK
ncbi:MAG: hypothetical protein AAF202_14175 [Pseudomonadota bacterium]